MSERSQKQMVECPHCRRNIDSTILICPHCDGIHWSPMRWELIGGIVLYLLSPILAIAGAGGLAAILFIIGFFCWYRAVRAITRKMYADIRKSRVGRWVAKNEWYLLGGLIVLSLLFYLFSLLFGKNSKWVIGG